MSKSYQTAEWLELSGLPAEMNEKARAGAWGVFKKIVELDCRRNRTPDTVEISLEELGNRCGLHWEKTGKILEALRRKKYLKAFVPDNPEEPGLFQVRVPIRTPRTAEEVALTTSDPYLRDPTLYRYRAEPEPRPEAMKKVQRVIDLYLNTLSQRMNSFIVDEIEILVERFAIEKIERSIRRGAKHEIRSIHWVARDLIREAQRPADKKRKKKYRLK